MLVHIPTLPALCHKQVEIIHGLCSTALRISTVSKARYFLHHANVSITEALLLGLCGDLTGKHACSNLPYRCLPPEADGLRPLCWQAAVHAQEEEEMGVTEEQAYAPITYNDGSSIDFQDKTLLSLTLERESKS